MFNRLKGVELKTRRKSKPIVEQAVFVPSLTVWGAVVAAAMVYVLPYPVVKRVTPQPIFDLIEPNTHGVAMAIAAVCGAIGMFLVARKVQSAALQSDEEAGEEFEEAEAFTIDPSEDLGSESLDSPLDNDALDSDGEDESFDYGPTDEPEWIEDTIDAGSVQHNLDALQNTGPGHSPLETPEEVDPLNSHLNSWAKGPQVGSRDDDFRAAEPDPQPVPPEEPQTLDSEDELAGTLDLGAFEGNDVRENGFEVEETNNFNSGETLSAFSQTLPHDNAIEKLRAVSPQELSLVEMVERLAVALHEKKAAASSDASAQERDAELAEALKHLSSLTKDGLSQSAQAKDEMQAAMSKLQNLRGAA